MTAASLRVAFLGTGPFGIPSLEALCGSPHVLAAIVTAPDRPGGRRLEPAPSPVKRWAASRGLPVRVCARLGEAEAEALAADRADAFVVVDFGLLLPRRVLDLPPKGCLNVHGSLLPRYRGAAPIQRAIWDEAPETGVSVIRMNERLDAGPVMARRAVLLTASEDAVSLERRLAALGAEALLEALERADRAEPGQPQDEKAATTAPKIRKEDGHILWSEPARRVAARVRALAGWPGTYTFSGGKRLLVLEAEAAGAFPAPARPGTVVEASAARGLLVAAADAPVRLTRLQWEGKRPLSAAEFLNGSRLKAGDILE